MVLPPVFEWLQEQGNIATREMARTFNCGIGMVAIVGKDNAAAAAELLTAHGETVYTIGEVAAGDGAPVCEVSGVAGTWGSDMDWTAETGSE